MGELLLLFVLGVVMGGAILLLVALFILRVLVGGVYG